MSSSKAQNGSQDKGHKLIVEKDVWIPLRDGGSLCADIFRPDTTAKVPVIANIRPSGDTYLMEDFFYAGGLPALLEQMDGFFRSGDHQRIFRTAHTIKGSSSNLSATGVSNAAREVELPARNGDLAAAAAALPALKASTAALIAELALEQNNHSSAGLCGATP